MALFNINPNLNVIVLCEASEIQRSLYDNGTGKYALEILLDQYSSYPFTFLEFEVFIMNSTKAEAYPYVNITIASKSITKNIRTINVIDTEADICDKSFERKSFRLRSGDNISGVIRFESFDDFIISDFNAYYIGCPKNTTIAKLSAGWACYNESERVSRAYSNLSGIVFIECPVYCKTCMESTIAECSTCADGYFRQSSKETCLYSGIGLI